jgi:hypothetical protein
MRRWSICLVIFVLIAAAIGCDKTITEPGESEHGGIFLHGTPPTTSR